MRYTGSPGKHLSRHWRSIALGASFVAAACGEVASPPKTDAAPAATASIARALAVAMSDAAVRQSVRDAMRYSLMDGHKLVLQDFLASTEGTRLREAAAAASGLGADGFARLLRDAERLDFSMPVREDRRAWRLDQPFAVMGPSTDAYVAYRPDGSEIRVVGNDVMALLPAFFYLEPEEYKGRRVRPQAAVPGDVIEEPNDGLGSQVLKIRYANGDSVVYDMADPQTRRALFSGGPGTTVLRSFEVNACDAREFPLGYYPCYTDLEVRIDIWLYNASGQEVAFGQHYQGGVAPTVRQYPEVVVMFTRLVQGSGGYYRVRVTEEDRHSAWDHDDFCGEMWLGDDANDDTRGGGLMPNCQFPDGGGGYQNSSVVQFKWSSPPPPIDPGPSPTPSITWGPDEVQPDATCTWEGSASGGTPPYTFDWYAGFDHIGSGPTVNYTNSGSSFPLKLRVTGANGASNEVTRSITVTSGAGWCAW